MRSTLATLLAVAGISSVQAELYRCDGFGRPNYEICDKISAGIPWEQVSGPIEIPGGKCLDWRSPEGGNCIISACNYRADNANSYLGAFTGRTSYQIIKQWCDPQDAGGQSPGDGELITYAALDPDWRPTSTSRVKRSAQGGAISQLVSTADVEARLEKARQAHQASVIQKRENSWEPIAQSLGITLDGTRDRLSAIVGSGATQTWSTTEGYSTSVSSTITLEAGFFDFFSTSLSISVTLEENVSYTKTLTFDPTGLCKQGQDAVLYMYPLFDQYIGYKDGDRNTVVTINVPVKGEENYRVRAECLG